MDQQKIGSFLKELRKEKSISQEQLAEKLNVSRRTVSRWETGNNLPDLDLLIELADYYQVDLRELLNGERKSEPMNKELKETVLQVAEYSNAEKKRSTKMVQIYLSLGILGLIINQILHATLTETNFWTAFLKGVSMGMALSGMILGLMSTTGSLMKVQAFKKRMVGRCQR